MLEHNRNRSMIGISLSSPCFLFCISPLFSNCGLFEWVCEGVWYWVCDSWKNLCLWCGGKTGINVTQCVPENMKRGRVHSAVRFFSLFSRWVESNRPKNFFFLPGGKWNGQQTHLIPCFCYLCGAPLPSISFTFSSGVEMCLVGFFFWFFFSLLSSLTFSLLKHVHPSVACGLFRWHLIWLC